MGFLANHLQWQGQVKTSAVYGCTAAMPADVAAYDPFGEATLDECLRYHDASAGVLGAVGRGWGLLHGLSRVRLVAAKGDADGAVDLLRAIAHQHMDLLAEGSVLKARVERVERSLRR